MIPEELRVRNFLCYRDNLPALAFDGIHVACLSGENGAGKSALLDAITWSLWGKARASDDELISLGEQEMEVDFLFQLNGARYRVLRKRSKANRGKTMLELHAEAVEGWKVLSGSTVRETQAAINSLLRMEYETFINSAFLVQGKADEFTRRPPAERKKILAEILGLDEYERLEARAKERVRQCEDRLHGLDALLGELESQAAKRDFFIDLVRQGEARVGELSSALAEAEAGLRELETRISALDAKRAIYASLQSRLETLRRDRDEQSRRTVELRATIDLAEDLLSRRDEILAGVAALDQARAALELWDERRARWFELREGLQGHEHTLRQIELELRHELQGATQELARIEAAVARRPALTEELGSLAVRLEQLDRCAEERQALAGEREALERRGRELSALLLERQTLQTQVDLRRQSLVATREEQQRRAADFERRLRDEQRWRQDLQRFYARKDALDRDAERLAQLREQERSDSERIGELRARCGTIKDQGEQVRDKLALLKSGDASCPLCGSDLGHDELTHIETSYQEERGQLLAAFRAAKDEADTLERGLEQLRAEITGLERQTREAQQVAGSIAQLESRLNEAEELRQQLAETRALLEDVVGQLDAGKYAEMEQAALRRVDDSLQAIGVDQRALEDQRRDLDRRLKAIDGELSARPMLQADAMRLRSELDAIAEQERLLPDSGERVRSLEQALQVGDFGHEARAARDALAAELAALGYSSEQHELARQELTRLQPWAEDERRLAAAVEGIDRDRRALAFVEEQLERAIAESSEVEEQARVLADELRALESLRLEASKSSAVVAELRSQLSAAQHDLGQNAGYLRHAEAAAEQIAARGAERRALLEEKELYEELARAYGKKGVQAMLIETAIPELEREANALISRMTDNQMHLSFETQRDTKKGETVETLEIKIADLQGTRDYSLYSGGEAFRVNFAIRIALSRLLARRAGASLQTLILDEGFGTQDGRGRERIVEAITSVQKDFARILVITHIQELKDLFPVQIEVVKTPDGSLWSVS